MKKYKNTAWDIYSILYILFGIISLSTIIVVGIKILAWKQEYSNLLGEEFFELIGAIFIAFILLSVISVFLFLALSKMNSSIESLYDCIDLSLYSKDHKESESANESFNQTTYSYTITKQCQACSICQENCPMQAIVENHGEYSINQTICVHCGLCEESCPYQAIKKSNNN